MTMANELTKALDGFYEKTLRPEFERLNGRMDGLDGRMDGLDGRMDGLDGRMGLLEGRMDRLEEGLDRLDERVSQLAAVTAKRLQDLSDRIEGVENRLAAFRIETLDRLSDLYGKFKSLDDEYHLIAAALRRLEMEGSPAQQAEWARLTGRLDEVERRLRDVEAKVDSR